MPSAAARNVAAVLPPDRRQQLLRLQVKPVGLFEGRQRRRALDEFRRGSELETAALGEIRGEVIQAFALWKPGEIAADRDDPGVVGRRGAQPGEAVLGHVEPLDLGICLRRVLPRRIVLAMEEDRAIAGVFGIEVDLPGEERRPHDVGRAELDAALDRDAMGRDHLRDHVAEQRAPRYRSSTPPPPPRPRSPRRLERREPGQRDRMQFL